MLWLLLSFVTSFFESAKDAASKFALKDFDEFLVAFLISFVAAPIIFVAVFITGFPELKELFWPALIASGSLNAVAFLLFYKGIKASDLSVTVPMLAFTPAILLITSPLILGEIPSSAGMVGILLIVTGSYLLNIEQKKHGLLKPFKALLREKGPKFALGTAAIWAVSANIDKIGIQNSSPLMWAFSLHFFFMVIYFTAVMVKRKGTPLSLKFPKKRLILPGFFSAIGIMAQMTAISIAFVPYVISIKRTSILWSSLAGGVFFKEKIGGRIFGASVMVLGAILIALA